MTKKNKTCSIPGCSKKVQALGWCGAHYYRWRRYGDPNYVAPPNPPAPTVCEVEGCNDTIHERRLCKAHYRAWYTMTPLDRMHLLIDRTSDWLRDRVDFKDDRCLAWPFGRGPHGYGHTSLNGRAMGAHRAMCILAHGAPPPGKNHAAHSCGNRLCVNPRHIGWASPQENAQDRFLHGTAFEVARGADAPSAKLTEDDVRAIREASARGEHVCDLSLRFRVRTDTIRCVVTRKTWAHVR